MKHLIISAFLTISFFLAGCKSEAEKRLEQIEKQDMQTQELYQQKARDIRKQLEDGQFKSPGKKSKEAEDRKGRDGRFEDWLTLAEVIELTGLTEDEIDQMVLQGKLKGIRRPNLGTLYDPAGVEQLKKEMEANSSRRGQK